MSVTDITSIIGTLGFPIVACMYMVYLNDKQDSRHAEEVGLLRKAIEDCTKTITELSVYLHTIGGGDNKNK